MSENFTEDSKIQQIAEAYALDAIDFAKDNFKLKLDWSDASISQIESMLDVFHKQMATSKPSDEQIFQFAKMFGSYVGEVFRRNHGAKWGIINLQGQEFPGLNANGTGGLFWPWGRAQNRMSNGPEDNMWHYYQVLLERNGTNGKATSTSTQKKSLWDRLRGA